MPGIRNLTPRRRGIERRQGKETLSPRDYLEQGVLRNSFRLEVDSAKKRVMFGTNRRAIGQPRRQNPERRKP